jgi:hypothetical protein
MYLDVYERDTSRYDQDTCKIHQNTSGYVSDRKPPPKRIGNPTSPVGSVTVDLLDTVSQSREDHPLNHSDRLRSSPTSYNRFISLWHPKTSPPSRRNIDRRNDPQTRPTSAASRIHLGRNRVLAYGPVCFPHSGVSGASASVRLMIQRHSARRASSKIRQGFVSVIN